MKFSLLGLQIYSTEYQSAQSTRVHKVPECTKYKGYKGVQSPSYGAACSNITEKNINFKKDKIEE